MRQNKGGAVRAPRRTKGRWERGRWYALGGALCALFLGACVALVFFYYRSATSKEFTAMEVENLNAYTAAQRDETLSKLKDMLTTLQALTVLMAQNDDPQFVEPYLQAMNQDSPETLIVYNTRQELDERLEAPGARAEDRKIIRRLLEGETVVTQVTYSERMGGLYFVAVAVPVLRQGECLGALRSVTNAEMLASTSVYPTSQGKILHSLLVNGQGALVPVRAAEHGLQADLVSSLRAGGIPETALEPLKEVLAEGPDALGSFLLGEYEGSPLYLSITGLGYNDWHLALFIQADMAAAHSHTIVLRTTYGAVALLLCVVAFCLVIFLLLARLLRRLSREQQRYLLLEQFTDTVLFAYDPGADTIRFTPNAQALFRVRDLVQKNFLRSKDAAYVHQEDRPALVALLRPPAGGESGEARMRLLHPTEDRCFWCLVQARYLYERGELVSVAGKVTDIDEQKRQEERLLHISETDGLTGLCNKATTELRIAQKMEQAGGGLLFMLDVDDFKKINDTHGHDSGDHALQYAARCMQRVFRAGDVLGRVGGDELVAYVSGTDSAALARQKMEQLMALLQHGEGDVPPMSVSVGIARFPLDGSAYDALYHAADQAMYRAKGRGKNDYQFYSEP